MGFRSCWRYRNSLSQFYGDSASFRKSEFTFRVGGANHWRKCELHRVGRVGLQKGNHGFSRSILLVEMKEKYFQSFVSKQQAVYVTLDLLKNNKNSLICKISFPFGLFPGTICPKLSVSIILCV